MANECWFCIVGHLSKMVCMFVCIHAYAVEKNDMNSSRVHTYTGTLASTPYGRIWFYAYVCVSVFFSVCFSIKVDTLLFFNRSLFYLSCFFCFALLCELSSDISKCVLVFVVFASHILSAISRLYSHYVSFVCRIHFFRFFFKIAFVYHKHKRMRLSFFVDTLYSRKILINDKTTSVLQIASK